MTKQLDSVERLASPFAESITEIDLPAVTAGTDQDLNDALAVLDRLDAAISRLEGQKTRIAGELADLRNRSTFTYNPPQMVDKRA